MAGVDQFKANFEGMGARPNLYEAHLYFPIGVNGELASGIPSTRKMSFLIEATSLPGSTLGSVPVPFRGRTFNVPGDRTFEDWNVTCINDTDFQLRNAMEAWMDRLNRNQQNLSGAINYQGVFADLDVIQLSRTISSFGPNDEDVLKESKHYRFYDAFPIAISAITLGYDQNDQYEKFDVTFKYQYFKSIHDDGSRNIDNDTLGENATTGGNAFQPAAGSEFGGGL